MGRKPSAVKSTNLVDRLKSFRPARKHASWFDRQPGAMQAELRAVKTAWRAGDLSHLPKTGIYDFCAESLGLKVSRSAFLEWLERDE